MKREYRKSNYYKQILMVLLLISLVPVFILGGTLSQVFVTQRNLVWEMQESSINNQKQKMDIVFSHLDNSMVQMILSKEFTSGVRLSMEAKNFQNFNRLTKELILLQSPEMPLQDIYLISLDNDWIMSLEVFQSLRESPLAGLVSQFRSFPQTSFWWHDEDSIYLVKQIPINTIDGNGMLIGRINKSVVAEALLDEQGQTTIVILDEEGEHVVGDGLHKQIVSYVIDAPEYGGWIEGEKVIQAAYHGESYSLSHTDSDYNSWTYISVIPNSELTKGIRQVYHMLVLVFLLVVSSVIMGALVLSKKLYHPIGALKQAVKAGISLDDYEAPYVEDEDDITARLQHIISKNKEMRKTLSSQKEMHQKMYLRELYMGEHPDVNDDVLLSREIIFQPIEGFCMYTAAIKYSDEFADKKDRQLYIFALQNIAGELVGNKESFIPVELNSMIYITFYHFQSPSEGVALRLQKQCEAIVIAVEQYLKMSITIGISRPFYSVRQISEAVRECQKVLREAINSKEPCMFYESEATTTRMPVEYKQKQKRMLILRFALLGDMENCERELDEYFNNIRGIPYHIFKLEINKFLSEILDCYHEYHLAADYDRVAEVTDFDIHHSVNSGDKLKKHLLNYFLRPLNDSITREAEAVDAIGKIIDYVNEQLENDISLEQCARHFNYNGNYLSRMFKKQCGKSFTEYVIERKLERCKVLLLTTELSVHDIALRLGYNSPQNFIRVFKKYTLMTPGQYRNKNRGSKIDGSL